MAALHLQSGLSLVLCEPGWDGVSAISRRLLMEEPGSTDANLGCEQRNLNPAKASPEVRAVADLSALPFCRAPVS